MPRPLPVGLAGRIHRLDRLVLAYHPPQFLPRARVGLLNRGHPWTLYYSITASARASSFGGISRPSAFAVWRLITSSNFVGCVTGRFAGFSPLRIRPT